VFPYRCGFQCDRIHDGGALVLESIECVLFEASLGLGALLQLSHEVRHIVEIFA
jgi:hypothetical protein